MKEVPVRRAIGGKKTYADWFRVAAVQYLDASEEELKALLRKHNSRLKLNVWDGFRRGMSFQELLRETTYKRYLAECGGYKTIGERIMPTKKNAPAPAEKAAKTPKPAGEGRGRARKFQADQKIQIIAAENPKRASSASAARFDLYKNGMTVQAALAAGVTSGDLSWDTSKGFISID
jgi:hypothetical protein